MFSNNYVVPSADFTVTGTIKEISKTADSGKAIYNAFCPNCGTKPISHSFALLICSGATLYRWGDSFRGINGMRIVQARILDDSSVTNNTKTSLEMFVENRIEWLHGLDGVDQFEGMP